MQPPQPASSSDSPPDIDLGAVRADTPGVSHVVHFNNAGSSLPPAPVLDATHAYLDLEATTGGYEAAAQEAEALDRVYSAGAELLGCDPTELAFVTGAATGWWRSFEAVPLQAGDRVLISTSEYQANMFGFLQAKARGVEIEVLPTTPSGEIDLDALAAKLDDRVKLVAVTQIAMTNGMVQPVQEIGHIVSDSSAMYLLDSCQAVGQMQVDVADLKCDFLSFTGRKFMRGPRGTGLLYVRSSVMDQLNPPSYIDGRSAAWETPDSYRLQDTAMRFEMGEVSYAAKAGFGVAIEYANAVGMPAIERRVVELAASMRSGLAAIDGVQVHDQGQRQSGIVTFTVNGHDPFDVSSKLRVQTINTSVVPHQMAQLDLAGRGIDAVVRAGVHYYNSTDEIDVLLAAVGRLAVG